MCRVLAKITIGEIMKKLIVVCLLSAGVIGNGVAATVSPEQKIFELNEEAMCYAAADYLKNERAQIHKDKFSQLTVEYNVPDTAKQDILMTTALEYYDFIDRANKRYDKEILPTMLLSAYTHRCYFMNGFEAGKNFNSEPPKI